MNSINLYEELFVFMLLLLGVAGIYIALKLHYVFAFGLMKNTSSYEKNRVKIEKAKHYLFGFLKILLVLGLGAMFVFGTLYLMEGMSLKALVFELWGKIADGFWTSLLFTLLRIAVLIIVSRYILRKIYAFLDRQQEKTIDKKVYNRINVEKAYLRLHNTIKFTVVLGIVYRITHFFPFLEEVSAVMLVFVILFFVVASTITLREVWMMLKTKNNH